MAPAFVPDGGEASKVKVKKTQLEKAIRALVQLVAKRSANANLLLSAREETMNVIFTLSEIPDQRRMKPMLIKLPHPMYDDKSEICFLAKDPQKQYKELLLKKPSMPAITKVIGLEELKRNYRTAESKRALADAFDLFLCDSGIVERMPRILGASFYDKKLKRPIPVKLKLQDPFPNLQDVTNGTTLRVPTSPCVGVRFGRCSMSEHDLVLNVAAVISFVTKHLPRTPVQTISVQATDSPALPIWRRVPPAGELVNRKKRSSDVVSSSASDTGLSGAFDAESVQASDLPFDAGETITSSELEADSEAGDVDPRIIEKAALPLVQGFRSKKRKSDALAASVEASAGFVRGKGKGKGKL